LHTARCEICRFDASSNQLVLEVSTGSGEDDPGEIVITANTEAPVGHALTSDQPVIADSAGAEPSFAYSTYLDEQGMVCSMTAVIKADENNRGVLSVYDSHKRQFLPHETNFLRSVADLLGSVLRRTQLELGHAQDQRRQAFVEAEDRMHQGERLASLGTLAVGIAHEVNNPLK
jgi:signal transduction protein with GAF and PtsI domain